MRHENINDTTRVTANMSQLTFECTIAGNHDWSPLVSLIQTSTPTSISPETKHNQYIRLLARQIYISNIICYRSVSSI